MEGSGRGHVLLLCADQLRARALSCMGARGVRTPNIDALSARGCTFHRHYTTAAPCGPARASLLTGCYTRNHGVATNRSAIRGDVGSLPMALARAGLRSFLIGYTDTVQEPPVQGRPNVMPGFLVHTYFNLDDDGLAEWVAMLERRGYGPFVDRMRVFDPVAPGCRTSIYGAAHSDTAFVADRTIDCIREHAGEPCLIHATFLRPHAPWVAPSPYDRLHAPDAMEAPVPRPVAARHPFVRYWSERSDARADVAEIRALYAGLVGELDFHVGRIVAALRECRLADETLVIFTSDHADTLGDHGVFGSGGFHDSAYHIPCIIADPTSPVAGHRVDEFTESVDLVPTILDWLSVPARERIDGHTMLPLLHGQIIPQQRVAAYWEYDFRAASRELGVPPERCTLAVWRTDREKYVHFDELPPLLFLLSDGIEESVNRASDPACRARMVALREELRRHRAAHSSMDAGR